MSFERYCNKCSRPFESENAYRSHLKHSSRHDACDICWRDFKSVHGRRGHMTSSVHQARDVQCQTCSRRFKSVADWASHVEPSYSHQQILRIVRHLKSLVNGFDWLTPIEDVDDEEVEDFHRFEDGSGSYKCPSCDKRFTNLKGLTQHLNSAVHRPASYRCMKCNFTSILQLSLGW